MPKQNVRTPEQALAYITDCNLATVSHMAGLRSKSKSEYGRQIEIAQTAVDWMTSMSIDAKGTRAEEVNEVPNSNVAEWARQFEC